MSKQMHERFLRRRVWRHSLSVAYVVVLTAYLGWRFTIINPDSLFLSVAYYTAECLGFLLGLTSIITSWNYNHRDPPPAPAGLSVDVFVPAYKEPLGIIRRTVMAAKNIGYPHGTWLLDDGKRDELEDLAAELGVRYVRRPDNKNAKAGNLNYALALSTADFVMTFDADHIALPHALDVMLGFFDDENVAMVQTPQDYYNTDAFQYMNAKNGALWHDQSFFYNVVQPSGDAANAATCVGTGVVYRRAALDAIGGIPADTVTEDIHTSLKLHKKGFRCIYLNEPIAYGIGASDLAEYYKTRHRWGHGNLHAMALENFLFCKELTFRQKFQYLALGLVYLEGWQQMLLFAIPVFALFFGLQPFKISIINVMVVLLFPFAGYFLLQEIGCGFTRYWTNELFSIARWPTNIAAFAGLFGRKMIFRSSAKNVQGAVNWRLMVPQLSVAAISLSAFAAGLYHLHGDYTPGPLFNFVHDVETGGYIPMDQLTEVMPQGYTIDLVAIAGFWALYSAVRAGFFVRKVIADSRNSHDTFRFSIPVPVLFDNGAEGCVTRISETWAKLRHYGGIAPKTGETLGMIACLPAGPLRLKMQVDAADASAAAGPLVWDAQGTRDRLADALYSVDWHREFRTRTAYFMTPSDALLRALRLQAPTGVKYGPWQAALYGAQKPGTAPQLYGVIAEHRNDPGFASLLTFQDLSKGERLCGNLLSDKSIDALSFVVVDAEPLSSLVETGLDGASVARYRVKIVA